MSKQMEKIATRFFSPDDPSFKQIVEKNTHMNLNNLKHEFIHLSDIDKIKPLKLLLKEYRKYARKNRTSTIIFCNSVASARAVEHTLSEDGMESTSLHGDIPPKLRISNYLKFKRRESDVLVATDLASRGLDLPFVSHIINFDCPKTTSDYLHRAGRAGRAGREGFVFTLYRHKDMELLEEMKSSHDNKRPLKIKGSAYSLIDKEKLIENNKNRQLKGKAALPRLGNAPKNYMASHQKYKKNDTALQPFSHTT